MEKFPLVSIVTLSYNKFDKVYQTIDSVLEQSYPQIEYIFSDDASSEFGKYSIENYIQTHKKKNIRNCYVVQNKQNIGTVKNITNAYKIAKGTYIINLSCNDVFYDNNVVEKIVNVLINRKCDVLVTSRILYKDEFKPICYMPHYLERKIINRFKTGYEQYVAILTGYFYDMASGSAMSVSKKIMEELDYFDERYFLCEDGPFFLKYTWKRKIETAYEIVSIWYQDGGVSSSFKPYNEKLKIDETRYNSETIYEHIDEIGEDVRKYIQFRKQFLSSKSMIEKIKVCVRYLPLAIFHIFYVLQRSFNKIIDKFFIRKIIRTTGKIKDGGL